MKGVGFGRASAVLFHFDNPTQVPEAMSAEPEPPGHFALCKCRPQSFPIKRECFLRCAFGRALSERTREFPLFEFW